jgi:hypothetical protein
LKKALVRPSMPGQAKGQSSGMMATKCRDLTWKGLKTTLIRKKISTGRVSKIA